MCFVSWWGCWQGSSDALGPLQLLPDPPGSRQRLQQEPRGISPPQNIATGAPVPAQTARNKTQRVLQACLGFAARKGAKLPGNGGRAADGLVWVLWKLLALSAGRVQAGLLGSCLPSAVCPMQAVSSPLSGHGLEPLTLNCSVLRAAAALLELSEDWGCRKGPQYCPRGWSCLDLISRRFLSARRRARRWGQVTGSSQEM